MTDAMVDGSRRSALVRLLLPAGVDAAAWPLVAGRALRALVDGYMAVLLPAYLLSLGLGTLQVGVIATMTMLGSALATLAVGAWGHRFAADRLLRAAALLMALTGLGFAGFSSFGPLLLVAFVGTLNPSSGDVSVFLPLEQSRLAGAAGGHARTALFARYSLLGALCAAVGALAAGLPHWLSGRTGASPTDTMRAMFVFYGAIGLVIWWLYRQPAMRGTAAGVAQGVAQKAAPLGPSRRVVIRLAALFSVDAFAGGLVVNSLMALWLFERFGLSLAQAGAFFFWSGLLGAASQLAAPRVARRIGLLNTMVFTHIPANLFLVVAAWAPSLPVALLLLFARSALSQMDVPTRTAYVMAVVTPEERAAAASFTAVPRSLAGALSPSISGALFAAGFISLPLVACGVLKIAYDLALWRGMRGEDLAGDPAAQPPSATKAQALARGTDDASDNSD